jgi:hypothetical protein
MAWCRRKYLVSLFQEILVIKALRSTEDPDHIEVTSSVTDFKTEKKEERRKEEKNHILMKRKRIRKLLSALRKDSIGNKQPRGGNFWSRSTALVTEDFQSCSAFR